MTRTRTDDELGGVLCDQLIESDFIVAVDGDSCAFEDEVLVDIPGERIVVVNENQVGCSRNWRSGRGMARRVVDEVQHSHVGIVVLYEANRETVKEMPIWH